MSKKIIINEGALGRKIKNAYIDTPLQNINGLCRWVPESGTRLITKHVTKNGVYHASDDNAYGYGSVIVNVAAVSGITGTGADGKEHTITSDPYTGQLVDNIAPVSIAVTMPPVYTGPYMPGAYIGFDGIVVHAYDSTGADMGAVPFEELIFPNTVVHQIEDGDGIDRVIDTGDGYGNWPGRVRAAYGDVRGYHVADHGDPYTGENGFVVYGDCYIALLLSSTNYREGQILCSDSPFSVTIGWQVGSNWEIWSTNYVDSEYEYNGKKVYYNLISDSGLTLDGLTGGVNYHKEYTAEDNRAMIAWSILYGNILNPGGNQKVPIQWMRPGDGYLLETYFGINVVRTVSGDD